MKKTGAVLRSLGAAEKVLLGVGVGVLLLLGVGIASNPDTTNTSAKKSVVGSSAKAHTPKTTYQTVVEKQNIPFGSTTTQSSSLPKGTTKITTAGVSGTKSQTYKVTYKDGKQTKKELVKEEVAVQPVTQVTTVGTYVTPPPPPPAPSCPNGTYVNSAGNTVCRPYASSSAPAGATARCVDGTYSSSQSRSGTCSHHGGVAQWL